MYSRVDTLMQYFTEIVKVIEKKKKKLTDLSKINGTVPVLTNNFMYFVIIKYSMSSRSKIIAVQS